MLLLPAAVLIVILVGVPFIRALWLSFHKKLLGLDDAPWIGLQNYAGLLADATFWQAVKNTFVFTTGSIGIKLALGLAIALVLNEALPLRGLWRSIVMLPYAMPTLVSVLVWKWMYNDVAGVLDYLALQAKVTDHPILWLGDPNIDGATRWQSLVFIVMPLAAPGVAVACIYSFTLAWNEYLYAFTLLSDQSKFTLATGLTKLIFGDVFLWGMIMAGGVLMSAPLLVLYFVAQRYIVAGLSAGAVKG